MLKSARADAWDEGSQARWVADQIAAAYDKGWADAMKQDNPYRSQQ